MGLWPLYLFYHVLLRHSGTRDPEKRSWFTRFKILNFKGNINSTTKYGISSSVLINYHAEDNSQLNYRFVIEFFSIDLCFNKGRNYVIFTSWAMTQHNDDSCLSNVTIVISSVALSLLISISIDWWLHLDALANCKFLVSCKQSLCCCCDGATLSLCKPKHGSIRVTHLPLPQFLLPVKLSRATNARDLEWPLQGTKGKYGYWGVPKHRSIGVTHLPLPQFLLPVKLSRATNVRDREWPPRAD